MRMPELEQCLVDLADWMSVHQPARLKTLHRGLSREEITALAEPLLPYRLPEEVYILYQWRNGQDAGAWFLPGYSFLPLEAALVEYAQSLAYHEGWNPLWFPILTFQLDYYTVVCDTEQQTSSVVLQSYNQDPGLYVWCASVEAMCRTIRDCYRDGIYYESDGYLQARENREAIVRQKYSPGAYPFVSGAGISFYSKIATIHWPLKWKQAIGLTENDYVPSGRTLSIAQYLDLDQSAGAGLDRIVFQGQITGLAGSSEGSLIQFSDRTGELLIKCPATTVGHRELRMRDYFEIEVIPREDEMLRYLERFFEQHPNLVATRIVFLKEGE